MDLLITLAATYLFLPIVFIGVLAWLLSNRAMKIEMLKLGILAFPASLFVALIAGYLYVDPRPFVVEHLRPLIAHAADNGFPSDHTLLSMTVAAVVMAFYRKLGLLLFVLGLLVGVSRVMAQVHHPVDILGSTIIAFLAVLIALSILKRVKPIDETLSRLLASLSFSHS